MNYLGLNSQLISALVAVLAAMAAVLLWFGQLLRRRQRSAKKEAVAAALAKSQAALNSLRARGSADESARHALTYALEFAYSVALHLPELRDVTKVYVAEVEQLMKSQRLSRDAVAASDEADTPDASRALKLGNQLLDAISKS